MFNRNIARSVFFTSTGTVFALTVNHQPGVALPRSLPHATLIYPVACACVNTTCIMRRFRVPSF
eukprot:5590693-Pleurochrysis_carterae.AAC.4